MVVRLSFHPRESGYGIHTSSRLSLILPGNRERRAETAVSEQESSF